MTERGTDVVVGFVEAHGRPQTAAQVGDLEIVPRRRLEHRGVAFEEMDVDAVLARAPAVALVDELAHTNVPGSRNPKRHQDVEELLAAGIDVISTLNIQHLESLNDVVARITGITQKETVPDAVVRAAEQVELVDMTPEALRRRMAHGNVYPADRIDAALANYFRPGNLGALRELALLWVADRVEDALEDYLEAHDITDAVGDARARARRPHRRPGGEDLIRRASRLASRVSGNLLGVHVRVGTGLTEREPVGLESPAGAAGTAGRRVRRGRGGGRGLGAPRGRTGRALHADRAGCHAAQPARGGCPRLRDRFRDPRRRVRSTCTSSPRARRPTTTSSRCHPPRGSWR